jgi:hypothetical protein
MIGHLLDLLHVHAMIEPKPTSSTSIFAIACPTLADKANTMTPHMPATEARQDRRPYEICCASEEHVGAEGHRTKTVSLSRLI